MSAITPVKRMTATRIMTRKGNDPIVVLTCYHTYMAQLIDASCDILLVGDSLGMVAHGMSTTVPVTIDIMILHAQAVMRGSTQALVIVDMPFGSYEESPEAAFRAASRIMKETGCGGVKLEGGAYMSETIRFLTQRGIPVMGHVGMTPQAIHTLGSFKARGRLKNEWPQIEADAHAVADAGAFAVVIEAVSEPLARAISQKISIPTIGIGASSECDGQVLVLEDMLGLTEQAPRFVKKYAQLGDTIRKAVESYAQDVKTRAFPTADHTYSLKDEAE